jgi:GNAT superfamily N-acetyltransferase
MNAQIRIAESNDMAQVLRLITELAVYEKEPDAVEITVDDLIAYGTGEDRDFTCFIAEREGDILGIALVYFRFSTWKGRTVHLEDLIVTKDKRGSGAGIALYKAVLKYGYDFGAKRVVWDVLSWNKNAIDFYKNTGATVLDDWQVVHMREKALKSFIEG